MSELNTILEQRGILHIATQAGWQAHDLTQDGTTHHGWLYPVYHSSGKAHSQRRWKNVNGNGPRYYWPNKRPPNARYYFLPGLRTAIQENGGLLYLASGEPDMLTYHAAGYANTLCWFDGELSFPKTLVDDLRLLGVVHVVYAPDRDVTGMRAAAKLVDVLNDTGITYHIAQLPGELGSKYDINQTWIDSGFDPDTFWGMVLEHEIDPTELAIYAGMTGKTDDDARRDVDQKMKAWRNEWIDLLRKATTPDGKHIHCPLPNHEDKNPSFRWSDDKTPGFWWPVCSCNIQASKDAPEQVAAAINAESWDDYKRRQATEEGFTPARPDAPLRDPLTGQVARPAANFISMVKVYTDLIAELDGTKEPDGDPLRFPYSILHRFDGFADWMWTGKAFAVGGISGGGKTSLLRVLAAAMVASGYDVAWWGPEWSPQEYGLMDLQRMGGLDFGQFNRYRAVRAMMRKNDWTLEEALKETGLSFPAEAERQKSIDILKKLILKPGQLFVIPDIKLPVNAVLDRVNDWATARRADGATPVVLAWDYLQLSNHPGSHNWKWGNEVADTIKTGCAHSQANLVAMISTQSRKSDSERVRDSHERLKVGAFQGLDESIFNLAVTITPGYGEDGQKLDWAALSVEKNNVGQTGMVAACAQWSRLLILDRENTDVNLQAYFSKKPIGRDGDD